MSELWDKMFKRTKKEDEIWKKINEENERFESTPECLEHREKIDKLYKEASDAQKERINDAKEYRKKRFPREKKEHIETEEERDARIAENRRKHEERVNSYPENLRNAIKLYESLSDEQKKIFGYSTWCYHDELDEMQNKQITHEQTRELHDILVQTCIDFINENGLKDVDIVSFSADSLQESARYNEWTSATDSFLSLEGVEKSEKDGGYDGLRKSIA